MFDLEILGVIFNLGLYRSVMHFRVHLNYIGTGIGLHPIHYRSLYGYFYFHTWNFGVDLHHACSWASDPRAIPAEPHADLSWNSTGEIRRIGRHRAETHPYWFFGQMPPDASDFPGGIPALHAWWRVFQRSGCRRSTLCGLPSPTSPCCGTCWPPAGRPWSTSSTVCELAPRAGTPLSGTRAVGVAHPPARPPDRPTDVTLPSGGSRILGREGKAIVIRF